MAGRQAGFRHNQETRDKIKAGVLIERLTKHVESDKPLMDASQVNAAKALLNKVLPDLSAVTLEGGEHPVLVTRIELAPLKPKDE